MSAHGFRVGVGAVAPQGRRAGIHWIREQHGRDGWTQAQTVPTPQGWAGEGISQSLKCILWEILCPSARAYPFFSQSLPGGSVHVHSLVRLLPSLVLVFCTQGSPAADVLFEYLPTVIPVGTVSWPLWFLSCWFLQNLNLGGEGAAVQTQIRLPWLCLSSWPLQCRGASTKYSCLESKCSFISVPGDFFFPLWAGTEYHTTIQNDFRVGWKFCIYLQMRGLQEPSGDKNRQPPNTLKIHPLACCVCNQVLPGYCGQLIAINMSKISAW